MTALKASLVA